MMKEEIKKKIDETKEKIVDTKDNVKNYIIKNPVKSVKSALAVGIVAGLMLGCIMKRR